jgi:hypothetical protein
MTDEQLRDYAADQIYYELWMLHETAMGLKHGPIDTDWVFKNAYLESFTIHARALAFFLYYGPQRSGDVTAEDYVRNVDAWKSARGTIPAQLQEVINRTGKEIAHLTSNRRAPGDPKKAWIFEHIFRLFFQPLHLFLEHAEPGRLHVSVVGFITALPTPPDTVAQS